ncbi:MAG: ATP-binding protein [Bacteroidales bacterium]|jgi:predicted AAA+ superfamily ATPase|nr:ATP-binding protein [Bacteroidales bacterium]
MVYIKRTIEQYLRQLSQHFPVLVVTGARQIGKTTLIKQTFGHVPNIQYVTLDYPMLRNLAKTDPELFLQQYPAPIIIDEIQYAPELLPYIKIQVDENRKNGQYFLTGSQMFHLMKNVSESLAGRVGIAPLYGLSRSEIAGEERELLTMNQNIEYQSSETITSIFDKIYRGSMPQMIVDKNLSPENYYGAYVQTYMERDIHDLLEIKKESAFLKFISCVAARTGQELNISDMASDTNIDNKTAERWLSLLVTSGLVFLLNPYSGNTIKRIVKRPKLYFMDTGLACYLSLWNNPRAMENSAMAGAFFETYVISELIKQYCNKGIDVRSRFSYYRDNNGREIDLIIIENGILHPIEIKKSSNPTKEALKNFKILSSLNANIGEGFVISLSSFTYPLDEKNKVVPIGVL